MQTSIPSTFRQSLPTPQSFDYICTVSSDLFSVIRAVYDLKQTQKLKAFYGKMLEQQDKTISEVRELMEMVAMQKRKDFFLEELMLCGTNDLINTNPCFIYTNPCFLDTYNNLKRHL